MMNTLREMMEDVVGYCRASNAFPLFMVFLSFGAGKVFAASNDYTVTFSTFFGGNGEDQGRGITADGRGNFYVCGGTASPGGGITSSTFPIVNGRPANTHYPTDPNCGQNMNAFVAKFSPTGQLLWSTTLGGPNYDRAYDVQVDPSGNVYVGGRGGIGFPVTAGAFQTTMTAANNGTPYGINEAWIAKLNPSGTVLWASWVGHSTNARSIAVDSNGDVYTGIVYIPTLPNPGWYGGAAFASAYQKTPKSSGDNGVVKIRSDGAAVIWATWYFGNTTGDSGAGTIRLDANKNVYFLGNTTSTNLFTTNGAAQRTYGGGPEDLYLAKMSANGSSVIYATYFGGNGNEYNNTHNLAVDKNGNACVGTQTTSTNLPATPGAYQRTAKNGSAGTIQVSKFSPTGGLLACTYVGGSGVDNMDGISVDDQGNIYLSGDTTSADFPVTAQAYRKTKGAGNDAVFVKLTPNLTDLAYSTFIGGAGNETGRDSFVDGFGKYYMIGQTTGAGWPLVNAYQTVYQGAPNDTTIAVFSPPVTGAKVWSLFQY